MEAMPLLIAAALLRTRRPTPPVDPDAVRSLPDDCMAGWDATLALGACVSVLRPCNTLVRGDPASSFVETQQATCASLCGREVS
eukprot:842437-Prymnesium_polylepis.2